MNLTCNLSVCDNSDCTTVESTMCTKYMYEDDPSYIKYI